MPKRDAYLAKAFAERKEESAEKNVISFANLVAVQGFEGQPDRSQMPTDGNDGPAPTDEEPR